MDDKTKPKSVKKYIDLPINIPPVHHSRIKLVCKKNNYHTDGLNEYFQREIKPLFKFNIHSGCAVRISSLRIVSIIFSIFKFLQLPYYHIHFFSRGVLYSEHCCTLYREVHSIYIIRYIIKVLTWFKSFFLGKHKQIREMICFLYKA
mgnify:CR=1 FL=1